MKSTLENAISKRSSPSETKNRINNLSPSVTLDNNFNLTTNFIPMAMSPQNSYEIDTICKRLDRVKFQLKDNKIMNSTTNF